MQTAPQKIRQQCRSGQFRGVTCGFAPGYEQANLVVIDKDFAFDFMLFCQRNPKPCPLLDVTDPGNPEPATSPGADLRSDLPKYNVFRHGELVEQPYDISDLWRDDFVAFLLGCSFSFENAMLETGLPVRHIEEKSNVPMYKTNIPCRPAGRFSGSLVVSMRPLTSGDVIRAIEITSRYPKSHGAPIHFGDPQKIGISDIARPDYGDPITIYPDEIPVFWACGVTPQNALREAKPDIAITHAPGHMFISDIHLVH